MILQKVSFFQAKIEISEDYIINSYGIYFSQSKLFCLDQIMQGQTYKTVHIQKLQYSDTQTKVIDGRSLWKQDTPLLTYQETSKPSSHPIVFGNGFFSAVYHAYNNHGDIKFTPDDVWIAIMLYFSEYVNNNSEKLRSAFVTHEGQKELTVQTSKQILQTEWDQFFTLMIEEIKKNTTKGVTDIFQCCFSTTGRIERIISTATVMNTYKKYFTYKRVMTKCGIQNVHFGGTLQDWKKILHKTLSLKEYDVDGKLKEYIVNVSQILEQFIQTYQGTVDLGFWNKIVHKIQTFGSGASTKYTGWITHLFGYYHPIQQVRMQEISFNIIVENRLTNTIKTVKLVGGFRAVSKQGCIYRPHLSMAILDAPLSEQKNIIPLNVKKL